MTNIQTIAVAGAGTMGSGIAQVAASNGFKTLLFDINEEVLNKAKIAILTSLEFLVNKQKMSTEESHNIFSSIVFTSNLQDLKADLIIEAVVERLDIKHKFFQDVAAINAPNCILASNTSSIPITQIAAKIPNPERVL
ncbi:MAG: hypothetical protein RL135_1887, partial [Bacteroidota bacterium]